MKNGPKDYAKLASLARKARRHSISPHSRFRVGSALATRTGKVYTGCNIENSSYGLTICAERTALFKAITEGERRFVAIAIASDNPDPIPPCGACRQVLLEHCGDIDVIMVGRTTGMRICRLSDLLPLAFTKKNLHS
jgi:cytidine deaminase